MAFVILSSREGSRGGGSGNLSVDETPFTVRAWAASERPSFPITFAAIKHYGRAWRLAEAGETPVLRMRINVSKGKRPASAYNVIADIPGTAAALASQIVMAGARLDSWAAGTGALDNASGVANVLEAARILKATGFKLRRTIRIALLGRRTGAARLNISRAQDIRTSTRWNAFPLPTSRGRRLCWEYFWRIAQASLTCCLARDVRRVHLAPVRAREALSHI